MHHDKPIFDIRFFKAFSEPIKIMNNVHDLILINIFFFNQPGNPPAAVKVPNYGKCPASVEKHKYSGETCRCGKRLQGWIFKTIRI